MNLEIVGVPEAAKKSQIKLLLKLPNCKIFIFEAQHANSVQIYFPILKISSKKCVVHLKLNLLHSRINAKKFPLKCPQIVYCVKTAFVGKLLVTKFCKVCTYVFRRNFFSAKCYALKLLLDVVEIFSKFNCSAEFSYQKIKCSLAITSS